MKHYPFVCALAVGMLLTSAVTAFPANAEEVTVKNISVPLAQQEEDTQLLTYDENGNAYIMIDGEPVTGKFSLTPDYHKGDANGNQKADASDAAVILSAAAAAGAGESTAEEFLIAKNEEITENYQAFQIADINGDDEITAQDAAQLLVYSSEHGAGNLNEPLGFASYQADENGVLQTGWVDDSHYADENYQLHTGWAEIDGNQYYFSEYGDMLTGWCKINGQDCYFDENGVFIEDEPAPAPVLQTGWTDTEQGRKYFDETGTLVTGWQEIDENTYYFDTEGIMQTGIVTIDDKAYRFQSDGIYHPRKICLDPGHYSNHYNHSSVVDSYYESNFTWQMHFHVKDALESYGFEVITTRQDIDEDPSLTERGAMSEGCDLFLSIHSNYSEDTSVDFPLACCQVCGVTDELGQQLADTIYEVMGTKQKGKIWKRYATDEENADWYTVLYSSHAVGTPGILLEHSFHSNLYATKWLMVDENLERMAQAEAKVISDYFA